FAAHGLPGQLPQPPLPRRQRTLNTENGLDGHGDDGREVRQAEPAVANPAPTAPQPDQDQQLADEDIADVSDVDGHDQVGQQAVSHGGFSAVDECPCDSPLQTGMRPTRLYSRGHREVPSVAAACAVSWGPVLEVPVPRRPRMTPVAPAR